MANLANMITNFISNNVIYVYAIAALAIVVWGICLILPSSKMREQAKDSGIWIFAGIVIVLTAISISKSFTEGF